MSEAMHTPGPWRTQGWVPTWAYIPVKDARHNIVCSIYPDIHPRQPHFPDGMCTRDEALANANLIAAAPDLLAAAKDLFALMDEGLLVRNIADDGQPDFAMRQLPFVQRLQKAHAAIEKAEGAQ